MDTREIATLTCRLLALYFTVVAFTSLVGFIPPLFGSADDVVFFTSWYAVNVLVYAGVALFLWRYAEPTARWLIPTQGSVDLSGLTLAQVQRLAFSVVGLIFAVQGTAGLLQAIAFDLSSPGVTNAWERSVSDAVKLVLGVLLFSGKDGLMGFLGQLERDRVPPDEH